MSINSIIKELATHGYYEGEYAGRQIVLEMDSNGLSEMCYMYISDTDDEMEFYDEEELRECLEYMAETKPKYFGL